VLCQLSYAPGRADCSPAIPGVLGDYAPPVQKRALGALFGVLAAALIAVAGAAIAGAGADVGRWVIALAALAIAAWLGSLALSAFRG
jgi:hypothetical protein